MIPFWHNLTLAAAEPNAWWKLKVEDEVVKYASTLEKIYFFIGSYFSDNHNNELEKVFKASVEKIRGQRFDLQQQILMDKITQLHPTWVPNISANQWTFIQIDTKNPYLMKPYIKGGRFLNFQEESYGQHFIKAHYMLFPGSMTAPYVMDPKLLTVKPKTQPESEELRIQWIGHSCCLIQVAGMNLLLDPSFSSIMPLFKRYTNPGIDLKNLPRIDAIGISHIHLDHKDVKALAYLKHFQAQILVPYGMKAEFDKKGFKKVSEHTWWMRSHAEDIKGNEVNITCVPAVHWSQSGLLDGNKTLWAGWIIEAKGKKVYFAGDTAFNEDLFLQIKNKFGKIDVALLPIAPCGENEVHMDHADALKALEILGAEVMIPIHWGAFRTGREKLEDPIRLLKEELDRKPDLKDKVTPLKIGGYYPQAAV